MTDRLRKAAQDVLNLWDLDKYSFAGQDEYDAIEAIRAALAETPEAVAWILQSETDRGEILTDIVRYKPSDDFVSECGKFKKWCLLKPLYTTPPSVDALIAVDDLANIIRTVDGSHTLGAGELAEKIIDAIRARGGA